MVTEQMLQNVFKKTVTVTELQAAAKCSRRSIFHLGTARELGIDIYRVADERCLLSEAEAVA